MLLPHDIHIFTHVGQHKLSCNQGRTITGPIGVPRGPQADVDFKYSGGFLKIVVKMMGKRKTPCVAQDIN